MTPLNSKSRSITQGDRRAPSRAMLRALGFTDEDFDKPIIGIANGQSEIFDILKKNIKAWVQTLPNNDGTSVSCFVKWIFQSPCSIGAIVIGPAELPAK